MNRSGRLIWVKSVLRAVPIYAMLAEHLPPWVQREIDAICRRFFWAGSDQSCRGKCMVAWATCCRPTEMGGLGISDLRLTGYALQTRWLWLQKTDEERAWSQLPIRVSKEVRAFFKASTYTLLGNGQQTLFWEDRWIEGQGVETIAPYIYQRIPKQTRQTQTVCEGMSGRAWVRCITGGLSISKISDYLHLWAKLENIQLVDRPDKVVWRWTNDGKYTSKSAYNMMHSGSTSLIEHKLIWRTWALLRVKIFLWLAIKRRHWTGDRQRRHGLEAAEACYLCDQGDETIDHIIVACPSSRELWFHILRTLRRPLPDTEQSTLTWWRKLHSLFHGGPKAGMDSLFALVSWHLWKERNARCFRDSKATFTDLLIGIKDEADRWIQAGASGLSDLARG